MNGFIEFLNNSILENVSKEEQISEYEKSLDRLLKLKNKLSLDGINTFDIEKQLGEIQNIISRRKSGTNKWYGAIIRIDQDPIHGTLMWRLVTRNGNCFHIPVNKTENIIKIPINWHQYPSEDKPINKLIEYRQEVFGYRMINLITYAENRTVDIVPFRTSKDNSDYFLIKGSSGLWAIPGGHIEEGELETPIIAARRELEEETHAQPLVIQQIPGGWVKENCDNSREYNSWTLPFIAIISPTFQMQPDDDAKGGSWFKIGDMPSGMHFKHHKNILERAFKFLPNLLKNYGKF